MPTTTITHDEAQAIVRRVERGATYLDLERPGWFIGQPLGEVFYVEDFVDHLDLHLKRPALSGFTPAWRGCHQSTFFTTAHYVFWDASWQYAIRQRQERVKSVPQLPAGAKS